MLYPDVAQLGSEATAARGGEREPSEWQRSAMNEGRMAEDIHRAPQQEVRLVWVLSDPMFPEKPAIRKPVAALAFFALDLSKPLV